jgi:hypothetical protein
MKYMFSQPMIALLFITLYSCSKKNTETGSLVGNSSPSGGVSGMRIEIINLKK